jgi:sulfhydrogenase subunit delta
MVARAGCTAPCPAFGVPCEACRGFIDQPNVAALEKVLVERAGFSQKRAAEKAFMFTANDLEAVSSTADDLEAVS